MNSWSERAAPWLEPGRAKASNAVFPATDASGAHRLSLAMVALRIGLTFVIAVAFASLFALQIEATLR